MAHYFIYSEKDASIYSHYPSYNYGLDEILEIQKVQGDGNVIYLSRTLMQFDLTNFSNTALSASLFYLNLYAANPIELAGNYTLNVYPVSSSWSNGTGFPASSTVKEDGISWNMRTKSIAWANAGSDYISNSVSGSQTFNYNIPDIRVDISNIVKSWISGTLPNNGLIIKFTTANESDSEYYGRLTFYSRDTHTVNLPTLESVWDDSEFITGSTQFLTSGSIQGVVDTGATISASISGSTIIGQTVAPTIITGSFTNYLAGESFEPVSSDQINIVFKNLKKEYRYQSNVRFRVAAKDLYQRKTFLNTNATSFSIIKYLPMNNTYYSVVDAYTGRVIIPFDNYTRVSCDLNGNYFDINLNGFMPERFYRIILKVIFDGIETYFDKNYIFKVTK